MNNNNNNFELTRLLNYINFTSVSLVLSKDNFKNFIFILNYLLIYLNRIIDDSDTLTLFLDEEDDFILSFFYYLSVLSLSENSNLQKKIFKYYILRNF